MRDNSDSLGYKPYITEGEEELTRNIEIRSHVRLYGQHDLDLPRSNFLVGHDHPYGRMGSMPSADDPQELVHSLSYAYQTSTIAVYVYSINILQIVIFFKVYILYV
jgi:hypothetical protein